MQSNYYNFQQSQTNVSYEPFMYDKGNSNAQLISGIVLLVAGIVLTISAVWKDGIYVGTLFGAILIINGLYRKFIEGKTKIEFSKNEDALYKTTPLGKKKKIALSNIYDIITASENRSYTYDVTNKVKPSAKSIEITSFIDKSRQKKQEVIFMETEIIPYLHEFLQLSNQPSVNQRNSFTP